MQNEDFKLQIDPAPNTQDPEPNLNLAAFRRRIRLLRVWRCGAIGGSLGAGAAVLIAALDCARVLFAEPWMLAAPVGAGLFAGVLRALFERLPDAAVARSMDRRGGLEDRLTTAAEVPVTANPMAGAQHHDAAAHLAGLRPAALYPVRPGRWHGSLIALSALSALIFVLGNTAILRTQQQKKDAAALRRTAAEVQRVAKPVLEQAKRVDASPEEKDLARRLRRFTRDMDRARMNRQEALVKANELAEQAKRLETRRAVKMAKAVEGAESAAAKLEKMGAQAQMEKSEQMRLGEEAALEKQIAGMQDRLAGKSGQGEAGKKGLSDAERKALERKLAAAQKRLQEIRLSQRAQEMIAKLQANPDFQEAQRLLSELAKQAGSQQAGQGKQLTQAQLDAAAKRLEELAKKLDTDEKLADYARQLREAAKNARLCKNGQCSGGLLGAFGLGAGLSATNSGAQGASGLSLGAHKGAGGPSRDRWVGAHGTLPRDDKSSLLNVKFQDRVITSERGETGPETYTEVMGPSQPGGKSSVPYQDVLPKYEKSAEAALKKSDIPPSERGKVRDYFDSLRQ